MKVMYMRNGKPVWRQWKELKECTEEEKKEANMRQIRPDEIVLDADKVSINHVLKLFMEFFDESVYKVYDYGREYRGHIHMIFPELLNYSKDERTKIRKIFIEFFGCDPSKASEDSLIAMEDKPHFKTGKIKKLVSSCGYGTNKLTFDIIEKFRHEKAVNESPVDPEELLNGVEEGKRNDATIKLATWYRTQKKPKEETIGILKEWNNEKNKPPLQEKEIVSTVEGAYRVRTPYRYRFIQDVEAGNDITRLISYFRFISNLFHDQFGDGYALINNVQIMPIQSNSMKVYLSKLYWDRKGKAVDTNTVNSAMNVLEAMAVYSGKLVKLSNRIAKHNGKFYYDLSNRGWEVVEISPKGWNVIDIHPPMFRRFQHQTEQSTPIRSVYGIDDFLKLTPIRGHEDSLLFKVVLVSYFIPDIPHPVMLPYGPQGGGKTLSLWLVKILVDPSSLEILSFPKNNTELVQMLYHHYCAMFDNVSGLKTDISDTLCRAVSGSGFSKRKLYTDDDDKIYRFKRAIGLNGINNPAQRPDLLDRAILFRYSRIPDAERKKEETIKSEFYNMRSSVLADIFDIIVKAMEIYPKVDINRPPRMVDFTIWGEAISQAMGYERLVFLNAYQKNIKRQNREAIDSHIVGTAIIDFMETERRWKGTTTELLEKLEETADRLKIDTKSKWWPKAPNALSRRINEIKSNLEDFGLGYAEHKTMTQTIKIFEWEQDKWDAIKSQKEGTIEEFTD